jgi:hypothetical protein
MVDSVNRGMPIFAACLKYANEMVNVKLRETNEAKSVSIGCECINNIQ